MFFKGEDCQLLKLFVSHQELLGSSRDVSVVVKDSHSSVSGLLHLNCDVVSQVHSDLGFLGLIDSGVD